MMEKAHAGKGHGNAVFVAAVDNRVIADGAAGFRNILYAAFVGALCAICPLS